MKHLLSQDLVYFYRVNVVACRGIHFIHVVAYMAVIGHNRDKSEHVFII